MPEASIFGPPTRQGTLGIAKPATAAPRVEGRNVARLAPATPAPARSAAPSSRSSFGGFRSRVPQFGNSVGESIAAIGFLLSQAAAGFRGQKTPLQQIRENQLAEERNQLNIMGATVNFLTKAQASIGSAPAGQRDAMVKAFQKINADFGGLVDDSVLADMGKLNNMAGLASTLKDLNVAERDIVLSLAGGNREKAVELLGDSDLMERLAESTDYTNRPIVQQKLGQMLELPPPELLANITDPATGRIDVTFPMFQALNERIKQANPDEAFSDGELGTLRRNWEAYGFVTPEMRATRAEVRTEQALGKGDELSSAFTARETALADGNAELAKALTQRINKLTTGGDNQAIVGVSPEGIQYPARFIPDTGTFEVDRGNGFEPMPVNFTPMRLPSVQAATAEDAISRKGRTAGSKQITKTRADALDGASTIESQTTTLGSLLVDTRKLPPGATGIVGNITNAFAGYLSQLDPTLGEDFVQLMTGGATKAEFDAFRLRARSAIASSVGEVAGEQSGRITKEELAITERALKLFESGASKDAIENVLQELLIQKLDRKSVV